MKVVSNITPRLRADLAGLVLTPRSSTGNIERYLRRCRSFPIRRNSLLSGFSFSLFVDIHDWTEAKHGCKLFSVAAESPDAKETPNQIKFQKVHIHLCYAVLPNSAPQTISLTVDTLYRVHIWLCVVVGEQVSYRYQKLHIHLILKWLYFVDDLVYGFAGQFCVTLEERKT